MYNFIENQFTSFYNLKKSRKKMQLSGTPGITALVKVLFRAHDPETNFHFDSGCAEHFGQGLKYLICRLNLYKKYVLPK